ncbi:hypothetical protein [Pseudomonas protegens]|uniref:hypothetical protein n=1 Tax=Pseudomonas protegens TaxID=380021 RepID=UPI00223FB41D|nr:hypothetical protein [Pseudomonas protegens]
MSFPRIGHQWTRHWASCKLRVLLGGLSLASSTWAAADEGLALQSTLTVLGYATWYRLNENSLVNPGNLVAQLPRRQLQLAPRPDFTLQAERCFFQLKPRAFASGQGERFELSQMQSSSDAYFNEARLSCQLPSALNLELGRGTLMWGNAILLSPSNPLFPATGKTDPVQEVYGKDLARLTWRLSADWQAEGFRGMSVNSRDMSADHFSPVSALKLNWTGNAASASVLAAQRDNGVRRLGAYGTLTLSDAWLVYGDGALGQGSNQSFVVAAEPQGMGWRFERNRVDDRSLRKNLLLGSSYTQESGWTHTFEALYNGDGYTRNQRKDYQRAIRQSNAALMFGDTGAANFLGQALLSSQQGLLGQRYALYQLDRTEWFNTLDVALRYTHALDAPQGGNLALSLNYKMADHAELFTFAQWNTGDAQSEYTQLARSSIISGWRYYF